MRVLEWHDIDMHVWVERVECIEFADGCKIHQQALALIGLYGSAQRPSATWTDSLAEIIFSLAHGSLLRSGTG